ncbi:hypothetical protein ACFWVP_30780 [Streptomyces sp. NPDC058637]|uniref:hypothetical protein n=1 Tax=Streptomyces sp. NPDC058637 TaxID=3346569 RepID=UPI0036609D1C
MAAANLDLLEGQFSDGCRKLDRDRAEADADAAVRLVDVVDGEPGDRSGPLGIKEQQQASEAVFGLEGVVVQQTTGGGPAGLVVHRLGGPFHRSAGKLRSRAIFWARAQRTKWPASWRRRASPLVIQRSRSACRQVARVKFLPSIQSRR